MELKSVLFGIGLGLILGGIGVIAYLAWQISRWW